MSKVLRSRSTIRPRGLEPRAKRRTRTKKPLITRQKAAEGSDATRTLLPDKRPMEELPEGKGTAADADHADDDKTPRTGESSEKKLMQRTGKINRAKKSRRPGRSRLRTEREVSDDTEPQRPIPARYRARLTLSRKQLMLCGFVIAGLVAASFLTGLQVGGDSGRKAVARVEKAAALTAAKEAPEEAIAQIDAAMVLLRDGEHTRALEELKRLSSVYPEAPSLDYAVALAALSAGDLEVATQRAASSAAKNQRTADAYALSAAIEGHRVAAGIPSIADPNLRSEEFLQKAIAADPLNPSPRIELAGIARRMGRPEEAIAHLRTARNLVQPVDSILVIDTTLALLEANTRPADPSISPHARAFLSALANAENGDPSKARMLLESIKNQLPPDTFLYLVNDPLLKKFSYDPELESLFRAE